jgi:hypothetical protein
MLPEVGEPIGFQVRHMENDSSIYEAIFKASGIGTRGTFDDEYLPNNEGEPLAELKLPEEHNFEDPTFELIDPDAMIPESDQDAHHAFELDSDFDDAHKHVQISHLSPAAFQKTCLTLEGIYDDIDDDANIRAQCVYNIVSQGDLLDTEDETVCGETLETCTDIDIDEEFPITLCQADTPVPADCSVSQAQIESCLLAHHSSLIQMSETSACDPASDTLNAVQTHSAATKCLQALNDRCPALLDQ